MASCSGSMASCSGSMASCSSSSRSSSKVARPLLDCLQDRLLPPSLACRNSTFWRSIFFAVRKLAPVPPPQHQQQQQHQVVVLLQQRQGEQQQQELYQLRQDTLLQQQREEQQQHREEQQQQRKERQQHRKEQPQQQRKEQQQQQLGKQQPLQEKQQQLEKRQGRDEPWQQHETEGREVESLQQRRTAFVPTYLSNSRKNVSAFCGSGIISSSNRRFNMTRRNSCFYSTSLTQRCSLRGGSSRTSNSSNSSKSWSSNVNCGEWGRRRSRDREGQTDIRGSTSNISGSLVSFCNSRTGESCRSSSSSTRASSSSSRASDSRSVESGCRGVAEIFSSCCSLLSAAFFDRDAAGVVRASHCVNLSGISAAAASLSPPLALPSVSTFPAGSPRFAAAASSLPLASNKSVPTPAVSLPTFATAAAASSGVRAASAASVFVRRLLSKSNISSALTTAASASRVLLRRPLASSDNDTAAAFPFSSPSASTLSFSPRLSSSAPSSSSIFPLSSAAAALSSLLFFTKKTLGIASVGAAAAAVPSSGSRPTSRSSRRVPPAAAAPVPAAAAVAAVATAHFPAAARVAAAQRQTRCFSSAAATSLSSPFASFSFPSSSSSSPSAAAAETAGEGAHEGAANGAAGEKLTNYLLSIDEALYAAKEANIYTTEELQKIILRSPSFSPDSSPLLLENVFASVEVDTPEKYEEDWAAAGYAADAEGQEEGEEREATEEGVTSSYFSSASGEHAEASEALLSTAGGAGAAEGSASSSGSRLPEAAGLVPAAIVRAFSPSWVTTFTHNNREWKVEAEGRGTRKRAAAHVIIRLGTGQVRVNEDEDLYVRWPYYYNRMDVLQPFYLTKTANLYDVFICARGGGPSGQAAAARLAIGRALVDACPACKPDLEEDLVLYEDLRQRMPKMPGRMKARKTRAWTKR